MRGCASPAPDHRVVLQAAKPDPPRVVRAEVVALLAGPEALDLAGGGVEVAPQLVEPGVKVVHGAARPGRALERVVAVLVGEPEGVPELVGEDLHDLAPGLVI